MKILSIIGARPQFIKEAIIQKEISKHDNINEIVVHTGQHYDDNMSNVFFEVLQMKKPEYELGIKASNHGEMTGEMIIELEKIMLKEKPELILLYGDTNSTLAGAIAASKLKIKIAHIEAGLRQQPREMPEEVNRVLTDRISDFLFVPSKLGMDNLKKEGIIDGVYFVGDVMYDIFLNMQPKFDYSLIDKLKLKENDYIVTTIHRDFNVDNPKILKLILQEISKINKEIQVVFPIHPRTQKRIIEFGYNDLLSNVTVIEPIDYLKLMGLTRYCYKTITDSGGYQKETYFSGKQSCIVMPDTGWRELIDVKFNALSKAGEIYTNIMNMQNVCISKNIYGDGNASKKIISILNNAMIS